jgi:GT2 family glycosyltransferase
MTRLAGSIIVVSRHRPQALSRCITALRQQSHGNIEVIVVADSAACAGLAGQKDLKIIAFDTPNISAARNAGLGQAAGDVALYIDDDAVPEHNWAARLIAQFGLGHVGAATGFVRARNGISYQWRAAKVDQFGQDRPLDVPDGPSLHSGTSQCAVKTTGTNCAFRTDILRASGGFDAAFAFFLDEADVNLRLASVAQTAVVPLAQVHHGYLASARRQQNRVPTTLFDIAASTAVFLRKHASFDAVLAGKDQLFAQQTARIDALLLARKIGIAQAQTLKDSLQAGWSDGMQRPFGANQTWPAPSDFRPLIGAGPRESVVIAGRFFAQADLHTQAAQAVRAGKIATVICLAPSLRRHKMQFLPQGYWWQSGGIWGRSDRGETALIWRGFHARVALETNRIAPFREKF